MSGTAPALVLSLQRVSEGGVEALAVLCNLEIAKLIAQISASMRVADHGFSCPLGSSMTARKRPRARLKREARVPTETPRTSAAP